MRLHLPHDGDPRELAEAGVEVWMPLTRPPDVFLSNLGAVRARVGRRENSQCRTWVNSKTGFETVYVRGRGKVYVHRLVLEAFEGPRPGVQARRLNQDKTDNRLCNLYWKAYP